jgi:uncharacterized protein
MLISHSVKNFQSFFERVSIDWSQNAHVPESDWVATSDSGERVAKVMAVLGHNASGKTALLKSLVFLDVFARTSFLDSAPDTKIPVTPHFLSSDKPVEFEIIMEVDKALWRYELHCNKERVLHEALYKKRERFGYVFIRDWDEAAQQYRIKQKDFGFPKGKAEVACNQRPNASLLSIAAQYGVPLAIEFVKSNLLSNIISLGRVNLSGQQVVHAAERFAKNQVIADWMKKLLCSWDLGLSDVELREKDIEQSDGSTKKTWLPFGVHNVDDKDYKLRLIEESSGTQGAFLLLSRLLPVLEVGGIAVIDEFESELHPHMLESILDLFANPKTNPHNAQMFFTCHAAEILNVLPKSEVVLVEKNNCQSEAWRLDDVEGIRSDDNFYAKYMSGAYGAVPEL